MKMSIDLLSFI